MGSADDEDANLDCAKTEGDEGITGGLVAALDVGSNGVANGFNSAFFDAAAAVNCDEAVVEPVAIPVEAVVEGRGCPSSDIAPPGGGVVGGLAGETAFALAAFALANFSWRSLARFSLASSAAEVGLWTPVALKSDE